MTEPLEVSDSIATSNQIRLSENLATSELSSEYDLSEYARMQKEQITNHLPFVVMKVDFDNSLYSAATADNARKLMNLAKEQNCAINVVTGNDRVGLLKKIREANLPLPEVISSEVGTKIEYFTGYDENGEPQYVEDSSYKKMVQKSGFDRRKIVELTQNLITEEANMHPDAQLNFQQPDKEKDFLEKSIYNENEITDSPFKVSLYFNADPENYRTISDKIRNSFVGKKVLTCGEINYNSHHQGEAVQKYCADILAVNKSDAMRYLALLSKKKAEQYSSEIPNESTYLEFAIKLGDSGNDQFLTEQTDANEIAMVAGGAQREIKEMMDKITEPHMLLRSFARIKNEESNHRSIYQEKKPGVTATDSLIRAGRFVLLGALRNPNLTLKVEDYLKKLYQGLTSIEKGQ